jgi:hypothetical protein
MQHVVIEDLKRVYQLGTVVETEKAAVLATEGVVTIPVEPALFTYNAVAGYFFKSWGAGQQLPVMSGICCQMVLSVVPQLHTLNTIVKLRPMSALLAEVKAGKSPSGMIRLIADSSQSSFDACGVANTLESVIDLSKLGELDASNAWIVRAKSRIDAPTSTLLGLAIYGYAREMRISWAAVSQTE